jgi:peptidoglycan pentaglycine glycine transferase (the first glycine)
MEVKQVDDYSGFNEYVARHPHGSVLQTTNWGQLKETTGWEWHPLAVLDGGKIAASALVLARPLKGLGIHILYSPRGPLFSSLEALNKLSQGVRELGTKKRAFAWKVDPALPPEDKRWQKFVQEQRLAKVVSDSNFGGVQPKYVMDLDITPPLQDILAQMKSKTRYNIRYAARKGVKVIRSRRKQDLSVFYALLQETAARDGFAVRDLSYFESMWDYLIEAGLAQLFLAYHGELPLAGAIAFRLGRRAWYVYGASSDELRNLQASHLMQWEMIKWAKAFGCAVYDFRGVSGELDPNNPLYGLYRFKEGFGATLREYVGEFDLVLNRPLYHMWQAALKLQARRRT